MERLISALISAPDWLRVRSVRIETDEGESELAPEALETFSFPVVPFTMTVEFSTSRLE